MKPQEVKPQAQTDWLGFCKDGALLSTKWTFLRIVCYNIERKKKRELCLGLRCSIIKKGGILMAIAGPQAPQAPTPPAVPGLAGASQAVGGLPDFGTSGQAAIEGAQQRAADAAQAGQDAAANARAAGERLMGTPERKTQEKTTGEESGKEGKLAQKPAAAPEAGGTKSQTTSSEAANLPPAAQAVQEKPGTETRVPKPSADEPPQGFGIMHLAVVAVLCACLAGIFAYKFLHRKKGEPTPAMRAAREAELLADLETMRAARERRESDRAAKVAAAGLSAIAGAVQRTAPEAADAADALPAAASAAAAGGGARMQAFAAMPPSTDAGADPARTPPVSAGAPAASDASMLASLSEALSAFREASRMMDGEAGSKATEEAKKAARAAAIRQDREEKQDGEHGGFEIRI